MTPPTAFHHGLSRRRFSGWCAASCAGFSGPLLAGAEQAQPTLRVQAVAPGCYFVQGEAALGSSVNRNFIANAGFVVTGDGVLVVDALGSPAMAEQLLAAIRGLTDQPVRYVVVTHYHADHAYGLQVFKAAGARIVAHAAARQYLASEAAQLRLQYSREEMAPWINADTHLVLPDLWVGEGQPLADTTLQLGGLDVVLRPAGPAHTSEDLMVWLPAKGVLYAGDLVFRGRLPFVGQADSRGWLASLDRMLAMRPQVVVPGHGPASTDPQTDLAFTRDYLLFLRQQMGEAARNLEPFDEAYARTDWHRYQDQPLFDAANRINAYNTYLLMEQQER